MNADTPRPYALFTLTEGDEATLKLAEAYALADVLNSSIQGGNDGPNFENLSWISGMIFERLGDIEDLMKVGRGRESEARGVKAPAQDPEPEPRKLNHYTPGLANAKVSLKAVWGYLEDLELAADDPAKVSAWAEMIHDELGKCEAA